MTLPRRLPTQAKFQWQTGQPIPRDRLEVVQPRRQRADAVETRRPKDETPQRIIIANHDVQAAIGLAGTALGQRTQPSGEGQGSD
jgi:hypothetical protein